MHTVCVCMYTVYMYTPVGIWCYMQVESVCRNICIFIYIYIYTYMSVRLWVTLHCDFFKQINLNKLGTGAGAVTWRVLNFGRMLPRFSSRHTQVPRSPEKNPPPRVIIMLPAEGAFKREDGVRNLPIFLGYSQRLNPGIPGKMAEKIRLRIYNL